MVALRSTPSILLTLVTTTLGLVACGTAPDPVASGSLCAPPHEACLAQRTISRSESGRNVLDLHVANQGPAATVTLDVDPRSDDATTFADALPATSADEIFPAVYELEAGESISDRFGPGELSSRSQLTLRLGCRPCEECTSACRIEAEYVFMTEPRECDNDDDCTRNQICHAPSGTCVDCLDDGDCEGNRSCHVESGRCLPPSSGGCGHHTPASPYAPPLAVVLALLAAGGLARFAASRHLLPALVAPVLAAIVLAPSTASTRAPDSTLSLASGPRLVTGSLGEGVERGLGVELHQALRWRHLGVDFWIETNYFVTTQPPPPLDHELQIFGFGLGPRGYLPIGPLELTLGVGYQRVGFGPNALVRQTGTDANFHSVGGSVGVGYRFSAFVLRTDAQFQPLLGADGSLLSFNLSFGVTTR